MSWQAKASSMATANYEKHAICGSLAPCDEYFDVEQSQNALSRSKKNHQILRCHFLLK
jgi:hypothetical protein